MKTQIILFGEHICEPNTEEINMTAKDGNGYNVVITYDNGFVEVLRNNHQVHIHYRPGCFAAESDIHSRGCSLSMHNMISICVTKARRRCIDWSDETMHSHGIEYPGLPARVGEAMAKM